MAKLEQDLAFVREVADNAMRDRCEYLKRAEAAELEAMRYRWLRDRAWSASGDAPAVFMTDHDGVARTALSGEALDAAIDAEIESEHALACAESAHRIR